MRLVTHAITFATSLVQAHVSAIVSVAGANHGTNTAAFCRLHQDAHVYAQVRDAINLATPLALIASAR